MSKLFSRVRIPYKAWGGSYFPAWQQSVLAEVNIGQFAGEAMARILSLRKIQKEALDYLVIGSTIPWHWKFWNATVVATCLGCRIPGGHIEQGCATGLGAIFLAATEVQCANKEVVGVLTFDRTSDSPVGVFPERRSYRKTEVISDVWDNFGFDPSTGSSMLASAGMAARKYELDRTEVDESTCYRYQQYFKSKTDGFLNQYLFPFDILNIQGRLLGKITEDVGIRQITAQLLHELRELDTCITTGTQTHSADGVSTLIVCSLDKDKELSADPQIEIEFVEKVEIRTTPGLMSEAPALAALKLLRQTGLSINDMVVVNTHNPFAINDVIFSKLLNHDWRKMNKTGSSLVWGHPQGPTLTRIVIEALEEAVDLGGGYALVCGCAAGDVGIAALFCVKERKP